MYVVWVKIEDALPWIELKRGCETRREAREVAEEFRKSLRMKVINLSKQAKPMTAVVTIKPRNHHKQVSRT